MQRKGIDISYAQGMIDFEKVKKDPNVEFIMIRATAGYAHNGRSGVDQYFKRNASECERLKIPYGFYHYSYATTVKEAILEAEHFLNTIKGFKPSYPVVMDFEDNIQTKIPMETKNQIVAAFMKVLVDNGYYPLLYTMASWYKEFFPKFPPQNLWVAHVNVPQPAVKDSAMWQYSWTGRVYGIHTPVDLDYCYVDFPAMIKANELNGWKNESELASIIHDLKRIAERLEELDG